MFDLFSEMTWYWYLLIILLFLVVYRFRIWFRIILILFRTNISRLKKGQKPIVKMKEYNLLMLGLKDSGKTTLIQRLANEKQLVEPTEGFSIKSVMLSGHKKLNIWDLGGGDNIRPFWSAYFDNKDGVIFVLDGGNSSQIQAKKVQHAFDSLFEDYTKLSSPSLLVLVNKTDKFSCMTIPQVTGSLNLTNYQWTEWKVESCSAITDEGFQKFKNALEWLTETIDSRNNCNKI